MKYSAFSYKNGNSLVHGCPAWIKIIVIPILNILFFIMPWYFAAAFVLFQIILAYCLHFTTKEQLTDLKPVIYYGAILLIAKVILVTFTKLFGEQIPKYNFTYISDLKLLAKESLPTGIMLLKLFCAMQCASIVFRTSTSLELREGIETIERAVRKIMHLRQRNTITALLSMFVTFIPIVTKIWNQAERAWKVRCGKKSVKMYLILIPVLFSIGMKQAYNAAKAFSARS